MIETTWNDLTLKYTKMSPEQMLELARGTTRQALKAAAEDVDHVMGRGTADAHPVLVAGAAQVMAASLQTMAITRALQRSVGAVSIEIEDMGRTLASIYESMP